MLESRVSVIKVITILNAINLRDGEGKYEAFTEESLRKQTNSACPLCDGSKDCSFKAPALQAKLGHLMAHFDVHEDVFGTSPEYKLFVQQWSTLILRGAASQVKSAMDFIKSDGLKDWDGPNDRKVSRRW